MAKAIFERNDDSFANKPITNTPVRDLSRVKQKGAGEFTIRSQGGEELSKVVPGANRTTIYKKLGKDAGYPRGFTPTQMRQVRNAESEGRLSINSDSNPTNVSEDRSHPRVEEAKTRETIARSRINPDETFEKDRPLGINLVGAVPGEKPESYVAGRHYGINASSINRDPGVPKTGSHIYLKTGYPKESLPDENHVADWVSSNLIHEIGHYATEKVDHFASSARSRGASEGRADSFAEANHVRDQRAVKKGYATRRSMSRYPAKATIGSHFPDQTTPKSWSDAYVAAGGKKAPTGSEDYRSHGLLSMPGMAQEYKNNADKASASARQFRAFKHPVTGQKITYNELIDHLSTKPDNS